MLAGQWTYRSFVDTPALIGSDAQAALALIFGEGVLDFTVDDDGAVDGRLDMGAGYALTIGGEEKAEGGFALIGLGIAGTATEGWRYDYHGGPGYDWPDGIDQVSSLLGTVVRVHPYGPKSPAGVTASFIAVRQDAAE